MTLLLALIPMLSFADSTQVYYAEKNVAALQELCAQADTRDADLLCRYRLYPLTQDQRYLDDLPETLTEATAQELALLSGLWGYRAAQSSLPGLVRNGRRAERLLHQARDRDPADPFVLLVEGQTLLFKPKLFGGDKREALACFERLHATVRARANSPIAPMEAELWIWYTHRRLETDEADAREAALLAQNPPPLYREFISDPP